MRNCFVAAIAVSLTLTACSAEQRADMEADKLSSYDLDPSQTKVAAAMVEGMKAETGVPMLRSSDYARIVCYTKLVDMPDRFERPHLLYLANYVEADRDYYAYFERHGVRDVDAEAMGERYIAAWDKCRSMRAMMKHRDEIKSAG